MLIAAILIILCACPAGALLWSLAIHALPLWSGGVVALVVHDFGGGLFIALVAGLAAGAATIAIGQLILGGAQSPLLRGLVGIAFALPAAIAGYHAAHGIVAAFDMVGSPGMAMSLVASAATGCAAWNGVLRPRREPRPEGPGRV